MMEERLPTDLWLRAHLRRCNQEGIPAMVTRRGDGMGGLVVVKLNLLQGDCRVMTQTRDLDGRMAWMAAFQGESVPEAEADAYIARTTQRDPDLWVVEIEHREGWHPFEGKLL